MRELLDFIEGFERKRGRVIFQMTIGRAGSLFLQSLLDDHPCVLAFPGSMSFYGGRLDSIAQGKQDLRSELALHLEESYEAHRSMHVFDELGPGRNETLDLKPARVAAKVKEAMGELLPSSRHLIFAIHFAAAQLLKRDLSPIRVIWVHQHVAHQSTLDLALADFKDVSFIFNVRDPRSNYLSYRKLQAMVESPQSKEFSPYWLESNTLIQSCWRSYLLAERLIEAQAGRTRVTRLEDIQRSPDEFVRALARWLQIEELPCLFRSTFGGKSWNGDSFSARTSGFRMTTRNEEWIEGLSPIRGTVIELLLRSPLGRFGYPPHFSTSFRNRMLAWLLLPLWPLDDFTKFFQWGFYAYLMRERKLRVFRYLLKGARQYLGAFRFIVRSLLSRGEGPKSSFESLLIPPQINDRSSNSSLHQSNARRA